MLAAVACRFLPLPPNFTPMMALALFGTAYFSQQKWAFLLPVGLWWMSDLVLNNTVYAAYNEGFFFFAGYQVWSFLAIALIVLAGKGLLKEINNKNILVSGLAAAVVFFLVSNFGVWAFNPAYPQNIGGLIASYIAGIPFFTYNLVGNVVFLGIMVYGTEYIASRYQIPLKASK